MYTKTAYDVVNRPVATYTGYAPDGDTHPWEITDEDKIFVQTLTTLDGAGNATQIASFHRNNGDTSTGPLTAESARVTYAAFWQDGAGRQIAAANGGTAPTPPLSAPPSSDSVLVSLIGYNARGDGFETTDPTGMVNRTVADDAGRQVAMIQNYQQDSLAGLLANRCPCGDADSARHSGSQANRLTGRFPAPPLPPPAPT